MIGLAKRIAASVLVHGISAAAAFVLTGLVHVWSGRGIWSIFMDAYQVRQMSIYLLDVIPFFIMALWIISGLWVYLACRRDRGTVSFATLFGLGATAMVVAVLAHQQFFPTSARALVVFALMATFYISTYALLNRLLGVTPGLRRLRPFPYAASWAGAVAIVVVAAGYVITFKASESFGAITAETESYRDGAEASPPSTIEPSSRKSLFSQEALPFYGIMTRLIDMTGDGLPDALVKTKNNKLELWVNTGNGFRRDDGFFKGVENSRIHDFYVADYDRDGLVDIMVSRFVARRGSDLRYRLKASFWYPGNDPRSRGYLYRQTKPGLWKDVTAQAFPNGQPEAFRKVEPMLWFDANGDGRLDLFWQQYPHPRKNINKLYVQQDDGTFVDRIDKLIKWAPNGIQPEGSDVADYDGDGDIDLFAYGFLFRNENGVYNQVCGKALPGIFCDSFGRNDEGALFEDVDANGSLDLVQSYHGVGAIIPKYYLQLFKNDTTAPAALRRDKAAGSLFYGFNTYLRAADYDLDGRPDILTQLAGRMLTYRNGRWRDMLPGLTGKASGTLDAVGWLDVDDDGDWDFVARDLKNNKYVLYRNSLNPARYIKLSARGADGSDNQNGATFRISMPDGTRRVTAYRAMAGEAGVRDPREIMRFEPNKPYFINACFPSFTPLDKTPDLADGITLKVLGRKGRCLDYRFEIADGIKRVDLTLLAGGKAAVATTVKTP